MDLNRIDGISNIANGSSVDIPLYIQDTIFSTSFLSTANANSSPVFTNSPIDYGNSDDTFTFNPLAYDADGDSLSFELIPPLQSKFQTVPAYQNPDQFCQARGFQNNVFQINSQTGEVTWNAPCQIGIFNVAVLVKEYRCGVLLSTVMSDMQIIVSYEANQPPVASAITDITIQPGDSISFNISATDPNLSQVVSLDVEGGAFSLSQNPPVFNSTAGNPATGTFTWQIDASLAKQSAYIFSLIARDNYSVPLKTYQTFKVWVADTSECTFTSIKNIGEEINLSLSPNPATNQLIINSSVAIEQINIYNTTGQLVKTVHESSQIDISHLAKGVYIAEIKTQQASVMRRWVKM